jgi:hypothetical protein
VGWGGGLSSLAVGRVGRESTGSACRAPRMHLAPHLPHSNSPSIHVRRLGIAQRRGRGRGRARLRPAGGCEGVGCRCGACVSDRSPRRARENASRTAAVRACARASRTPNGDNTYQPTRRAKHQQQGRHRRAWWARPRQPRPASCLPRHRPRQRRGWRAGTTSWPAACSSRRWLGVRSGRPGLHVWGRRSRAPETIVFYETQCRIGLCL